MPDKLFTIEDTKGVKYPSPPDYKIATDTDPVLAGMTYTIDPDIQGNRFNTVDIDLNSKESVDALNAAHPEAWSNMYPDEEPYTFSAKNAYKLKRAVELYMWLYPEEFGISNTHHKIDDPEISTSPLPEVPHQAVKVPYNSFMTDTMYNPYRIAIDALYTRDFLGDATNLSPVPFYYGIDNLAVEIVGVEISDAPKNGTTSTPMTYIDPATNASVVRYVSYITDNGGYAPLDLPVYTPYLMDSVRRVKSKMNGEFAHPLVKDTPFNEATGTWEGFSNEYLNLRVGEVGKVTTPSPYDAYNEFAQGKHGFPF